LSVKRETSIVNRRASIVRRQSCLAHFVNGPPGKAVIVHFMPRFTSQS
jgi:hypothetical protein